MKFSEVMKALYESSDFHSVSDLAEAVSKKIGRPVSRQIIENIFHANRDYMEVIDGLYEVLSKDQRKSI